MKPSPVHEFLDALLQVRDVAGQRAFVSENDFPASQELIEELSVRIREWLPKDRELVEALTETNFLLASQVGTPLASAFANQCKAYVFMNMRKGAEAQLFYEKAAKLFGEAGADRELGRNLLVQTENLTALGKFDRAKELAQRAKDLLEATGDAEFLPRVHVALGNLFYRLNRFNDSLGACRE